MLVIIQNIKEKESIKAFVHLIHMADKKVSQEFRLKNIDKTGNFFVEEIKENDLMNKKQTKNYAILNCIELFPLF